MRVLIDTDPGLGFKYADVDDGLALFLMLNNPEFEIEGITTVFGNTSVDVGYPLVRKYLKLTEKTAIPHERGAATKDDLGKLNKASRLLIEKVKDNPGELTLLTLGPFTNVATALLHYPSFLDDLKQVVIMGGTLTPLSVFNPRFKCIDRRFYDKINIQSIVCEFNCLKDPLATKKVIEAESKTSRVQMGLEVCTETVITQKEIDRIGSVNKPIPQFIYQHVQFWLRMWKLISARGGFFPFDTCVPIYLLNPELFKMKKFHFAIDTKYVPGKVSIIERGKRTSAPIDYCVKFVNNEAKRKFLKILISNLIN